MSMLFKRIKDWVTSITAFRTGDVIPVDGPSGTAKMSKDDLLKATAQNALGSIHSLSDTATEADLVSGNYFAIDGSAGTKKLPAENVAKRSELKTVASKGLATETELHDTSCTFSSVVPPDRSLFLMSLKAGVTYTFELPSMPSFDINFHADATTGAVLFKFSSSVKSVTYTPSLDYDYLYVSCYAAKGDYTVSIHRNNVSDEIATLDFFTKNFSEDVFGTFTFVDKIKKTPYYTPIRFPFKAGVKYTFSCEETPGSDVNFYTTDSAALPDIGVFNSSTKSFSYTFAVDSDVIFYTSYSNADLTLSVLSEGSIDGKIEAVNGRIDGALYSGTAEYLPSTIVRKHVDKQLTSAGKLGNLTGCFTSDFIDLSLYKLDTICYAFYASSATKIGVAFYTDADEDTFISGEGDKQEEQTGGGLWYKSTKMPLIPDAAKYMRICGRSDVFSSSTPCPSVLAVKSQIEKNKEDIAELDERVDRLSGGTQLKAKAVILDTDFGGDIDDFGAMTVLHWAERVGMVDIVGVHLSVRRSGTSSVLGVAYNCVSAVDAVCTYYGVPDMCIGLDKEGFEQGSNYCGACMAYNHTLSGFSDALDSPEFYAAALAAIPEGETCDLCIVGHLTGISRFMSTAENIALVNSKIRKMWIMGGGYPVGFKETNLSAGGASWAVNATMNVLNNYTGEIVFIGAEQSGIHCGDVLYSKSLTYLMGYVAMHEYMQRAVNAGRYNTIAEAWAALSSSLDVSAVLAMCDDNLALSGWDVVRGTNTLITEEGDDYGKNVFTPSDDGKHYYVTKAAGHTNDWYTHRIDTIVPEFAWPTRNLGRVRAPRS